jgi:hypothetical protein
VTSTGWWTPQLNAVVASVVVAVGAWLAWDSLPLLGLLLLAVTVAGLLAWHGHTITRVWAWATLLLGLESFSWPLLTMAQIRSATAQPTDEQMGTILSAVVAGLLSAVFWISFSYGLFKRSVRPAGNPPTPEADQRRSAPRANRPRKRR